MSYLTNYAYLPRSATFLINLAVKPLLTTEPKAPANPEINDF